MKTLQNFHVITVSFIGATDYKGSRVKIHSYRFKKTVIIDYDHKFNNTFEIAQNYLEAKGFELVGKAETKDGYTLISTTFDSIKSIN